MRREAPTYSAGGLKLVPLTAEYLPVFREMLGELVDILDVRDFYTIDEQGLGELLLGDSPKVEAAMAWWGDEPAGFVTWSEGPHMLSGNTVMSFEYIYVRPKYRAQMITMALLIYLAVVARMRDYMRIEGFVHDWNSETAQFYRRLKVKTVGEQTWFRINVSDIDWAPLEKLLGSRSAPEESRSE
jgi:GNAT superfamily N-acetyltransferase